MNESMDNNLYRQTDRQTDRQNNCINLIRLIAAIDVVYGHAIKHLSIDSLSIVFGNYSINFKSILDALFEYLWGVPIFFFLSGFLIWDSIGRSKNYKHYLMKRVFRIFPELWVAVVIELLSVIILYKEKIKWLWLGVFGFTQGTFLQFWTPNFLRGYGCGTPNGALWTICVILQFYLVAWFLKKILSNKSYIFWTVILLIFVAIGLFSPKVKEFLPLVIYKLYGQTLIPYLWMFLLGGFLSQSFDQAASTIKRYWSLFFIASIIITFVTKNDLYAGNYPLFTCILLYLTVIGFSYSFPALNVRKDISYGIYLYHMIVINAFIQLGWRKSTLAFFLTLLITVVLAYISTETIGRLSAKKK